MAIVQLHGEGLTTCLHLRPLLGGPARTASIVGGQRHVYLIAWPGQAFWVTQNHATLRLYGRGDGRRPWPPPQATILRPLPRPTVASGLPSRPWSRPLPGVEQGDDGEQRGEIGQENGRDYDDPAETGHLRNPYEHCARLLSVPKGARMATPFGALVRHRPR